MNLTSQADLANDLELPIETLRSYGARFALYVPSVRNGAVLHYPREGVQLLGEIHQAVLAGATFDEIEVSLQDHLPVAVVSASASAPDADTAPDAMTDLLQALETDRAALHAEFAAIRDQIAHLATTDQFHGLRAETASLAAALAQRDSHWDHTCAVIAAELRDAVATLSRAVADLHADVLDDRAQWNSLAGLYAVGSSSPASTQDRVVDATPSAERRGPNRTPRRMGQPQRANGLPQT